MRGTINKSVVVAVTAALLLAGMSVTPAHAIRPADEINTVGVPFTPNPSRDEARDLSKGANRQGASAMMSQSTPVVKWFESMDDIIFELLPSQTDRAILKRPLNQEVERLQEWIAVATRVSKNYKKLSKIIRASAVPPNAPGLREYRDLRADWYSDVADVYGDLIKPREPSKTIEEHQAICKSIQDRSTGLKVSYRSLMSLDKSLRDQFRVHKNRHSDEMFKYITNKR